MQNTGFISLFSPRQHGNFWAEILLWKHSAKHKGTKRKVGYTEERKQMNRKKFTERCATFESPIPKYFLHDENIFFWDGNHWDGQIVSPTSSTLRVGERGMKSSFHILGNEIKSLKTALFNPGYFSLIFAQESRRGTVRLNTSF